MHRRYQQRQAEASSSTAFSRRQRLGLLSQHMPPAVAQLADELAGRPPARVRPGLIQLATGLPPALAELVNELGPAQTPSQRAIENARELPPELRERIADFVPRRAAGMGTELYHERVAEEGLAARLEMGYED